MLPVAEGDDRDGEAYTGGAVAEGGTGWRFLWPQAAIPIATTNSPEMHAKRRALEQ